MNEVGFVSDINYKDDIIMFHLMIDYTIESTKFNFLIKHRKLVC